MMILLAMDTAGADCAAGLFDMEAGIMLASVTEDIGKGHAEMLPGMVEQVTRAAKLTMTDISRIAVTVGPGSFTGIRVGVSMARGLALALGTEAIGISTLAVISHEASKRYPGQPILAAIDAKRDEVYAQLFGADGAPLNAAAALSPDIARQMAKTHGATIAGSGLFPILGEPMERDRYPVETIARLAASATADRLAAKPLYLRGADAKPQTGYALAHV